MTDIDPLALSPEYQQLRQQYETLVSEYTALVARYQDMVAHESPHLSALYMHYFGELLYNQLRLSLSIALLRLRRTLLQAYINRDEAPDLAAVDKQMAQMRQEYHAMLEEKLSQLNIAKKYWDKPHLSEEETQKIKEIYKTLVKRLHPDLNPHYTEEDKKLFLLTVKAYQLADLPQLEGILAFLKRGKHEELFPEPDSLPQEIEKLRAKMQALESKIAKRQERFPFDQKELLLNPVSIQDKRAELQGVIKELETSKKQLQTIISLMEEYKSHEL